MHPIMSLLFLIFPALIQAAPGIFPQSGSTLPEVAGQDCDRMCNNSEPFHCVFNWRLGHHILACKGDTPGCYGDGHLRQVTLIVDDQEEVAMPGPAIAVCQGDKVSVNLVNELESESGTIHWHGLPMRNTQWSDGVPGITQCPIEPGQVFSWYNFNADTAGTYWFHSHSEFQRDDGVNGPLIIRDAPVQVDNLPQNLRHKLSTTCDETEHTIMIQEWYFSTAEHRYNNDPEEKPTSILVNGKGRSHSDLFSTVQPWQVFTVHPEVCSSYRFRIVSSVDLHCPIQVSIEDHRFTVIATDGEYIDPEIDVSSVTLSNGERFDLLLDVSDHEEKTYVIRFGGAPGEFANCKDMSAIAFLQYGSSKVDQKTESDYSESINVPGRHINPLPTYELPTDQIPIPVADLRSIHTLDHQESADKTFYLQMGDGANGANINNVQFDLNSLSTPLLSQEEDHNQAMICDSSYTEEGLICDPAMDKNDCSCHHMLHVDSGDVVDMFLLNPDLERPIAHPIHLHGHFFNVIGSGSIPDENPMAYIREQNEAGNIERNLDNPPRKDSIQSIPGGYLLIRFYADNPGYWLMHCHISFDVVEGQVLVVKVGDRSEWDIPQDFPECGK